ncbi:MAG: UDP-N-acetylglucosamine 2-epimerase (non-hydrolyzing) [Candidatus Omnitrophica bacterium]|nr:UDP-N-acetylglucosamine 2-epimerase (non-hydrolyzing) [Candidatus Omnitrophota bacterium]
MRIVSVVGARPNFVKIAPINEEFKKEPGIENILIHTGQHYDNKMSDLFFDQIGITKPDINLGVGSASHAVQTANIMKAFEPVCKKYKPDGVLVVGDVNSTIACGLVAVKLGIKLIHVESGLRSGDRGMPEEINRVLTDSISDILFCTEQSGVDNLLKEGISRNKIFFVGNVMIDALLNNKIKAENSKILNQLLIRNREYAVLTLHRPDNVDNKVSFNHIVDALESVQKNIPIVFPVHPRTRDSIEKTEVGRRINSLSNIRLIDPLGYLDFIKLISCSRLVLTDSGGIQEETTILNIPCLTLRNSTERPITAEKGTNVIVGTDCDRIVRNVQEILNRDMPNNKAPKYWDGRTAGRIKNVLLKNFS